MEIRDFLVSGQNHPVGIDKSPYFSWKLESDKGNVMQKAYQLCVRENSEIIWDSGVITSDQNAFVAYQGPKFKSRGEYQVSVTVWDNYEETSSADNTFEMALLERCDWIGQWIQPNIKRAPAEIGFGNQDPATLFRKKFTLGSKPIKARLYSTCHGIYHAFVNDSRCDISQFAPEHTMYEKYLCYQTTDVLSYVKEGENSIEMYVSDGWMFSHQSRANIADLEDAHSILFQLEVELEDHTTYIICSDDQVEWSYGPVRASDLYAGEKYDANQKTFQGQPCVTVEIGYDHLHAQNEAGVQKVAELPVLEVIHTPKGEIVLDFGQVIAGRIRMNVDIPKNEQVILEHAEVLDRDGNFFNNISGEQGIGDGVDQKDLFISAGQSAVYEPLFTFHGFRYVKVTGLKEINPDDFKAIVLSSEQINLSSFETSDNRINKLYNNTRWSQRSNMLSIPTDCPQREKAGWTGDINIYSRTALLNADLTELLSRWLENLAEEQDEEGRVPIVVPYNGSYPNLGTMLNGMFQETGKLTSAGWSDAAVMVPYHMYQVTGNQEILKQQYTSMKNWCDYVIKTAKEKHNPNLDVDPEKEQYLWDTGFHWGEWLIPSTEKNPADRQVAMQAATSYISPIFGWNSVKCMAEVCQILGQEEDAIYYQDVSEKMRDAIMNGLIKPHGKMPAEFMGAYVLAIYFDLVPAELREKFEEHLIQMLKDNDGCLDTGFLGTPYILDAFCKMNRLDLAYDLLWQDKAPSWMYEIDHGATGIWENWFSYENGQPRYTSMNHYAFGCVDDWMFRYIGGIKPDSPGFKHITICPRVDSPINESRLELETVQGKVLCAWKKENENQMDVEVLIPCNATATVILPDNTTYEIGSGRYTYHVIYGGKKFD